MNIDTLLRNEIQEEFDNLKKIETGSDTYETTVNGLTKLMAQAVEIEKFEADIQAKADAQQQEYALKREQMAEDKKDRFIRNCLTAAGIAIPALITVWGTVVSLKFETTGVVTSIIGRGFINKLLPKK